MTGLRSRRGSAIFEFAITAVLLMLVIFAGIEFDRMALVYATVANSARVGLRYAITHGSDRTDGPFGQTEVRTVVKNFASAGLLTTSKLNITVTYAAYAGHAAHDPGSQVTVSVVYPYDPLVALPLSVNLNTNTTGIIAF